VAALRATGTVLMNSAPEQAGRTGTGLARYSFPEARALLGREKVAPRVI